MESPEAYECQKRICKIRLAIDHILSVGRVSGAAVEVIVGHLTWACLTRREMLSIFDDCYRFIKNRPGEVQSLWASVRQELRNAGALLHLMFRDISLPWSSNVWGHRCLILWARGL